MSDTDLTANPTPTDLTMFSVPEHLKSRLSALDSGPALGGRYVISFAGSRFAVKQGGETVLQVSGNEFPVVILGSPNGIQRQYFENTYDPSKPAAAPDCWSSNGVEPHATAAEPQNDKCQTCKWSAKNSRIVNGRGMRACRMFKQVAVLPIAPIEDHENAIIQMNIASMSIWGDIATTTDPKTKQKKVLGLPYKQYAEQLNEHGVPPFAVVTMLRFDINSTVPRPLFSAVGYSSKIDGLAARINKAMQNPELEAIINCEPPAASTT